MTRQMTRELEHRHVAFDEIFENRRRFVSPDRLNWSSRTEQLLLTMLEVERENKVLSELFHELTKFRRSKTLYECL